MSAGSWWRDWFQVSMVAVALLVALFILIALLTVMAMGLPDLGESLASPELLFAVRLSLETSLVSTMLCIAVAVPVAYVLARVPLPGKPLLGTLFDLPLALPPIVSGFCLLLVFGDTAFGSWLERHGLVFVFTIKGIIVAQLFVNLPYTIRVLHSIILSVDRRLEFIARTLGCSNAQAFFKVTLPLSRNGIIAGAVITWAKALGEFGAVLMLAGATRYRTETLPIALFLDISTGNLKAAMAVAGLLILISAVSLFLFNRLGKNSVASTRVF